jgi:mannose-6-phosphate isomerase-like protein (cupin superfamily)
MRIPKWVYFFQNLFGISIFYAIILKKTMNPFVKHLSEAREFTAGDRTRLRELLHPEKDGLSTSFSIAHAYLKPGEASIPHILAADEVYYFLKGRGKLFIDGEPLSICEGSVALVPAGSDQWVLNEHSEEKLIFLCIVSPFWKPEGEKLIEM